MGGRKEPGEKAFLDWGLMQTKAQTSLMCLRVRKTGACGWTWLVRGKGKMKLGGGQGLGTLGMSFDDESSGKP